ncbi:MAG: acyloxyacyl hydrolase [Candidatus Binatia bacterium]
MNRVFNLISRTMGLLTLALVLCAALPASSLAGVAFESGGPVVALGFSSKSPDVDLYSLSLGWRYTSAGPAMLGRWNEASGGTFSIVVEPLLTLFSGDRDSFDLQLVPMLRFVRGASAGLTPYLEAGIGFVWSDLRGLKLGSRILFSDQAGVGVTFALPGDRDMSLGYRIRHESHAGLWAEANSGLNTHFLVFALHQ